MQKPHSKWKYRTLEQRQVNVPEWVSDGQWVQGEFRERSQTVHIRQGSAGSWILPRIQKERASFTLQREYFILIAMGKKKDWIGLEEQNDAYLEETNEDAIEGVNER